MSNIILSASLLYLAAEEAGCLDEETEEIIDDCDNRINGFRPAALIANVAVATGLLAAFLMPVIGAVIDYSSHRRTLGIVTAALLVVMQGAQIGTVSSTWLIMSILQAIVGFVYEVSFMIYASYLPEMSRELGDKVFVTVNKNHFLCLFGGEVSYLFITVGVGTALDFDDVRLAQFGMLVCFLITLTFFWMSWRYMPSVPPQHELPEGRSLLLEGFRQNWMTCQRIQKEYKNGLRWFLLCVTFAEAGTTSLMPIAVTFLSEELGYSGSEIGISFFIAVTSITIGVTFTPGLVRRTDPNIALQVSLAVMCVVTVGGFFLMTKERRNLGFVWGGLWGLCLGVYYTCQRMFFSLCLPEGQDAELAGFFGYTLLILSWAPPLVFSILVENGVEQRFGLIALLGFQLAGLLWLRLIPSWDKVLEEARNKPTSSSSSSSSSSPTKSSDPAEKTRKQDSMDIDEEEGEL